MLEAGLQLAALGVAERRRAERPLTGPGMKPPGARMVSPSGSSTALKEWGCWCSVKVTAGLGRALFSLLGL